MNSSAALQVITECPVCNDPIFSEAPCPRCAALGQILDAKQKAGEQQAERMRLLGKLPRVDMGVMPYDEDPPDGEVSLHLFLAGLVLIALSAWGMWFVLKLAIQFLLAL